MKLNKKTVISVIVILIIVSIFVFFILTRIIYKRKYIDVVASNAKNNLVDPYLIFSIIKAESNFNENSISYKNAYGLMQILLPTAVDINKQIKLKEEINNIDLLYPDLNIALGTKYISTLIKYYNGNYCLALCAYNAGCGNVDKWIASKIISYDFNFDEIDKIPFNETKSYLKKVIKNYNMYKVLY